MAKAIDTTAVAGSHFHREPVGFATAASGAPLASLPRETEFFA